MVYRRWVPLWLTARKPGLPGASYKSIMRFPDLAIRQALNPHVMKWSPGRRGVYQLTNHS